MTRPKPKPYQQECTDWLRAAIEREIRIQWMSHAHRRMGERGILRQDVYEVLETGSVKNVQTDKDIVGEKWRVEGRDLDDRELGVVVGVPSREGTYVSIITVFEIDKGNPDGKPSPEGAGDV